MQTKKKIQKVVLKNIHNKINNRYYLTTLKTLIKKIFLKLKNFPLLPLHEVNQIKNLISLLNSFYDKSVKKKILTKSFSSKKKSIFGQYFFFIELYNLNTK